MKTLSLVTLGALLMAPQVYSADEAVPPYQLKNRSSFNVKSNRSPFWPVGWKPTLKKVAEDPVEKWKIAPEYFTVTSVLLSNPPLATINGRSYGEGEMLPVVYAGEHIKVVVKAIRDGGVWLDQSGYQIFVPIRRQEIAPKAANEGGTQATVPEIVIPGGPKDKKHR